MADTIWVYLHEVLRNVRFIETEEEQWVLRAGEEWIIMFCKEGSKLTPTRRKALQHTNLTDKTESDDGFHATPTLP